MIDKAAFKKFCSGSGGGNGSGFGHDSYCGGGNGDGSGHHYGHDNGYGDWFVDYSWDKYRDIHRYGRGLGDGHGNVNFFGQFIFRSEDENGCGYGRGSGAFN